MKKTIFTILGLLLFLSCFCSVSVFAENLPPHIDYDTFPNDAFREFVTEYIDTDGSCYIEQKEINAVKKLTIDDPNMTDLTGIEYFTALEELVLDIQLETPLDFGIFPNLISLDCGGLQLTALDVSKNTALVTLLCDNNRLTALDLRQNTALENLDCSANQLTALALANNKQLVSLDCSYNRLSALALSQNSALKELDCSHNQLFALELSGTSVTDPDLLCCTDNVFIIAVGEDLRFDLSEMPNTFQLEKASNWKNAVLSGTVLTVSGVGQEVFYTYQSKGDTLPITFCLKVTEAGLPVTAEHFPDENFRKYILENIDTDENGQLSEAEIAQTVKIELYNNGVEDLTGIEYFTELIHLAVSYDPVKKVDLSKNTKLQLLGFDYNELTELDVSKNTALQVLVCSHNHLTTLDVSKNLELWGLACDYNDLTEVDISMLKKLTTFSCSHNANFKLDVSKNPELTHLDVGRCNLTVLDLSGNPKLTELRCNGNPLTFLKFEGHFDIKDIASYDCYYLMSVGEDRTFDLSTLPKGFDFGKTSNWQGGSVSGAVLTLDDGANDVTYTYDCGNGMDVTFCLHIHGNGEKYSSGYAPDCDWEYDGALAYYVCSCGERYLDAECTKRIISDDELVIPWTHAGGVATCANKAVCVSCGKEYGEIDPENHDYPKTLTYNERSHYYECSLCGEHKDEEAHTLQDNRCVCTYEEPMETTASTGSETTSVTSEEPNESLSGGAIAAIVISALLLVGGGGFAVYRFVIQKKKDD